MEKLVKIKVVHKKDYTTNESINYYYDKLLEKLEEVEGSLYAQNEDYDSNLSNAINRLRESFWWWNSYDDG